MSKVYNNNLIKSIIATILVVVFAVTIILIPFNTVYAAEDNGVVVTDTEITFDGYTIPRYISSNLPLFDKYGYWHSSRYSYTLSETAFSSTYYIYIYIESLNCVMFFNRYPIVSFNNSGFLISPSSYDDYCFSLLFLDDFSIVNYMFMRSNVTNEIVNVSVWGDQCFYSGSGSTSSQNSYSFNSLGTYLFPLSGVNFLTDIKVLYANYRINGFYEPDDSDYDLPDSILSYQYLFYRPEHGYVFIDSGEKLSDLDTSLTNVNSSGSFTSSFWVRWPDSFNKLVYKSVDGVSWNLLNGSSVYGSSFNTSDSLVRDVLGIPSGNSVSVWSYFQNTPNIPEDLVMTEFSSGNPIGQTIEFDSGTGEYTSGSSISDIVSSYSSSDISFSDYVEFKGFFDIPKAAPAGDWLVPTFIDAFPYLFLFDTVYIYNIYHIDIYGQSTYMGRYFSFSDSIPDTVYAVYGYYYLGDTNASGFRKDSLECTIDNTAYSKLSTPHLFFNVLLDSLNGINDNILSFDTNMQTGFTNLTSQVKSLFDSSEVSRSYLFDIKKALSDLAEAGGPDLTGVEDKLNQIISGLGSGSFELLPVDDPDSPLYSLYDKVEGFSSLNDSQNLGILGLLTSINDSVGDISDQLDDGNLASIASFIASFGLNTSALAAIITDLYTVGASLHSGMELFSGTVSKLFDTMPTSFRLLVVLGPSFALCTAMMYGARKMYG